MAKDKINSDEVAVKQAKAPKEGTIVDLSNRVKVEVTESPYHKSGSVIECSPVVADKMERNGWGTRLAVFVLFMLFAFAGMAQNTFFQPLTAGPSGPKINLDTVTNAATNYLTSYPQTRTQVVTTAFTVTLTKISGTVAGTLTLLGSASPTGENFKAVPTVDTQTSITTVTALDVASQVFTWRIVGSPYLRYRLSWTGTGTMAASIGPAYLIQK